jgi:hypothetical protein
MQGKVVYSFFIAARGACRSLQLGELAVAMLSAGRVLYKPTSFLVFTSSFSIEK